MLNETCMLASLNIRSWGAKAKDRKVTQEVADQHGTATNVGCYTKKLIAQEAINAIHRIADAARQEHYYKTLPWSQEGARILSNLMYEDWGAMIHRYKLAYDEQVVLFLNDYPNLINEAKGRLNGLFNANDYPSVLDIEHRFSFDFSISSLPSGKDFRVELARHDVEQIKLDIEKRTTNAIADATRNTVKRMADVVEHLAERLVAYNGTRTGSFKDTLVDNVRDLVMIVPKLNITGDPEMDRLAREMDEKLCKYDASMLREDVALRVSVADEAQAIFEKLKAMGG